MDRKSKKKIGSILGIIVAVIIGIWIFLGGIYDKYRIQEEQIQELILIYPEIENEIKNNFLYYQVQMVQSDKRVIITFFLLLLGSGFVFIKRQKSRNLIMQLNQKMDVLYEQLVRFQKGDFERKVSYEDSSMEESNITNKLNNIYEKLCELGYYFSDLKVHLLEEENNTKTLITDISHQLKTPLASIRMCHELANSCELSEEEREDFLAKEALEIKKMEVLLKELVNLSYLENNMIQIHPKKNSLKQMISEAVSQIFMKAYEKNIEIYTDMEEDIEIVFDRKWTEEAFVNILENAIKYSEPITTIGIKVSRLPNNVLLEVEDQGMGILEEELHKIFTRFYRGSNAKEKEGAGIGLYLARSIIEQQGGTIVAKRKQKQGTIFKIMLPL